LSRNHDFLHWQREGEILVFLEALFREKPFRKVPRVAYESGHRLSVETDGVRLSALNFEKKRLHGIVEDPKAGDFLLDFQNGDILRQIAARRCRPFCPTFSQENSTARRSQSHRGYLFHNPVMEECTTMRPEWPTAAQILPSHQSCVIRHKGRLRIWGTLTMPLQCLLTD
jgi:hypothetical protein